MSAGRRSARVSAVTETGHWSLRPDHAQGTSRFGSRAHGAAPTETALVGGAWGGDTCGQKQGRPVWARLTCSAARTGGMRNRRL